MSEKNRIDELDGFWDIDVMLPKKPKNAAFSYDTGTEEIDITPRHKIGSESGAAEPTAPRTEKIPKADGSRLAKAREALGRAEEKLNIRKALSESDRDLYRRGYGAKRPSDGGAQNNESAFSSGGGKSGAEEGTEYSPTWNPLITKVRIEQWPARYTFYERFRTNAVKYIGEEGVPCEHVPFFSYTPQYSQLSSAQLNYYLYFRSRVKRGELPEKADFSYVLLLLYEIINIPDIIGAEEGAEMMITLWRGYRALYPKLDRTVPDWLCDYCLINRCAPPKKYLPELFGAAVLGSSLKEFYVGSEEISSDPVASALFVFGTNYNYRSSKFICDENRALFDKHIRGAFFSALAKRAEDSAPASKSSGVDLRRILVCGHAVRDSYSGALCAYNVKRRICVDYLKCPRAQDNRFVVTDIIKYAENNVRALLGIRSRFHTPNLPMSYRNAVDEYFAPLKKKKEKNAPSQREIPEYEKLYEASRSELSLEYAREIEEKGWVTTSLLTENGEIFSDPGAMPVSELGSEQEDIGKTQSDAEGSVLDSDGEKYRREAYLRTALYAVLNRDNDLFKKTAGSQNMLPDALCENINEVFFEIIGDSAVYEENGHYLPIEDYREDIEEWMKK